MATKKQKREAGLKKRAEYFEELRKTGLEAQKKDREYRASKARREVEAQHKEHRKNKRLDECPLCVEEQAARAMKAQSKRMQSDNDTIKEQS